MLKYMYVCACVCYSNNKIDFNFSLPEVSEMEELSKKNERDYQIPRCPLGVDGTMMPIKKPQEEELPQNTTQQDFWCR